MANEIEMRPAVIRIGNGSKTHRALIIPSPHGPRFAPTISVLCGTAGVNRMGARITRLADDAPVTCEICNGSHAAK